MTEEGTKRYPWVPKDRTQGVFYNDGWLGSEGGMFGLVEKKWTRTMPTDDSAPVSPRRHLNNDFLGGCSAGDSPKWKRTMPTDDPISPRHHLNNGCSAGGSPGESPKPIKIEGARRSIKDNPFLKNQVVL
jgi:hypothetical protein